MQERKNFHHCEVIRFKEKVNGTPIIQLTGFPPFMAGLNLNFLIRIPFLKDEVYGAQRCMSIENHPTILYM